MEPPERSVAIVGMDCRFPGSNGLEDFWETLKNEENHITEIPKDRWNIDAFYDENPDVPGKSYVKRAGTIDGIYDWDNILFDVNEYEAMRMDPQQKLALEVTYNAFQNAGLTENELKGTDTAVFMGLMNDDFANLVAMDTSYADNYTATGTAMSLISNRISYTFDLRGPSVTMDTACSSSLVAVNYGITSILSGESKMAVCGGVTVFLGPGPFIALCKARMASKVGQCHAFSQKADGYVRSEGCGIVILKDAKQALKDNDRIWGYIASSCNSDGRTENPISNPSKLMQKRLIETAMHKQGLDMHNIQYVEMHGTGTPVGDPTEVGAVGETIGQARKEHNLPPLHIGSVKSNIGHTEAAAGVAGIIKTLLMMNKGQYVPSLFYDDLNPSINFDSLHVTVVNRQKQWPELNNGGRLASVNCFGFGGTNVHATIQTYKQNKLTDVTNLMPHTLICFSGKSETSVKCSIQDTLDAIIKGQILNVSNLQFSSMYKRNHFRYRKAVVSKIALSKLKVDLQNEMQKFKAVKIKQEEQKINTVFVFCGMGTHWEKMGLELYETVSAFRDIIDEMDAQFFPIAGFKLSQCFQKGVDLTDPVYGQPAIFAVQVGLYAMLKELGVMADVIIGHSVGEVAAAYASNSLSLRSAVHVIYHRSRLLGDLHGGAMLAVGGISVKDVEARIYRSGYQNQVSVAAYNTKDSCTLSGQNEAIDVLQQNLMKENNPKIFVKKLDVAVAYHSQYMDPVMEELKENLEANDLSAGSDKLQRHISTVSCMDDTLQFKSSEYWTKNVRQPVMFDQAFTKALQGNSKNVVIEIGPRAPLRRYIEDLAEIEGRKLKYVSAMKPNSGSFHFMSMIAEIYEAGKTFELRQNAIIPEIISWPKYGHDKKTLHFFPKKTVSFLEDIMEESFEHAFVSRNVEEECCVSRINKDRASFIFDHIIDQDIVIPGATYVEIAAVSAYLEGERNMFRNGLALSIKVFFKRPCIISKNDIKFPLLKTNLFPIKEKNDVSHWEYDITQINTLHATGEIRVIHQQQQTRQNISLIKSRCMELFTKELVYQKLKELRFNHGPKLQCIKSGQQNGTELLAEVSVADENYDKYILHPAMLDCVLQLSVMLPATDTLGSSSQVLPFGIENIVIESSPPQNAYVYISISESSDIMVTLNAEIIGADGKTCVQCSGLKIGIIGKASIADLADTMFGQSWDEVEVIPTDELPVPKCMLVSNYSPRVVALMAKAGLADLTIDIETILSNKVELKHIFPPETKECTDIIFAYTTDSTNLNENSQGEEISNIQTDLCYSLLRCITFFQTYNSAIQITSLTSQVYEILRGNGTQNVLDGLLGYAQWGMMRTVITENLFQKIRTLDVFDHQLVNLDMVNQVLRRDRIINEISIKHGIAKCCRFQQMPRLREHRLLTCSSKDTVTIATNHMSESYDNITTYLQTNNELDPQKYAIKVENTYVLNPSITFHRNLSDGLPDGKQQLRFIGATGIDKKNRPVHVIAIAEVSNKINVHKDNLIRKTIFPSVLPSAPHWLFAWKLVHQSNLKPKSNFCILKNNDHASWASAIQQVCILKGIKQGNITESHCIIVSNTKQDTKFLFEQISTNDPKSVAVLTWNNEGKKEICSYLDSKVKCSKTVICLQECYENETVAKADIKHFKKWLISIDKRILHHAIGKVDASIQELTINLATLSKRDKLQRDSVLKIQSTEEMIIPVSVTDATIYRHNSAYIVFGGSKGQGWEIVLDLVENRAGKIGIVSRNGLTMEKEQQIRYLERETSCTIIDLKADIANYEQLLSAKKLFEKKVPENPLKGIFIGSVVVDDATIANMTLEKFRFVQKPKVTGIWNVHKLFIDESLDFFVAHSSLASMLGNPGQTNYAAANAFVDAFMCYRRNKYGVGQSICWGAMDLGLLEDQTKKNKVISLGIGLMNVREIKQCLHHSLIYNPMLISYAKFNWEAFIRRITNTPITMYFGGLIERKGHYLKLSVVTNSDRQKMAKENKDVFLEKMLQTILMVDEDDEIDPDVQLLMLGADSQHGALMYSAIVDSYGEIHGLSPVNVLQMTLNELQLLINPTRDEDHYEEQNENETTHF